ncbi:Uncharacterised protein [Ewingella americana]|uniref:Uncharacterized protein n=1 Tax=Ewingella americana TaxID=41202 RepID=A0A377NA59_9GAMM|nr:Uncharacterised protein [Ewingella americana]
MIDNLMLTGRSAAHLAPINEGPHRLQPEAVEAFTRMQDAAVWRALTCNRRAPFVISSGN